MSTKILDLVDVIEDPMLFNKIPTNIKDAYFVTHDLIAAAYALLMGVNVIFLAVASGGRGPRVYIFKNINYETNINEYMHAQLIEKRDTVLARLIEYNTKRTEIRYRNEPHII